MQDYCRYWILCCRCDYWIGAQAEPPQHHIPHADTGTKPSQHNLQVPADNFLANIRDPTLAIAGIIKHNILGMDELGEPIHKDNRIRQIGPVAMRINDDAVVGTVLGDQPADGDTVAGRLDYVDGLGVPCWRLVLLLLQE